MGVTLFARCVRWHLHALGSNPLTRRSDRLEALAVLAVLATALVAVPLAALTGSQIRDTGVRNAIEQSHSRHSVEAVAVEGSAGMPADFDSPASVRAQWREGGRLRTEQIVTPGTVQAGQELTIWLDATGKVVTAPLTAQDAELSALVAECTLWCVMVAFGALAALTVRIRLDRSRERAWERELQLLAHNDDGWANRHT
ncbi:Rv1733c family protein [Mycolicibacterium komossense]|uniref:Transmembrane protein n=1 Tax=Mycolicibacterium komossense TaxID=1779 RepID=A0ABT3CN98_9MYCO|nr:hypothetical protein [Mycolicibacterium komossense]MCV7230808.1 hypothetical protein [Mycolicibacterium komossense]